MPRTHPSIAIALVAVAAFVALALPACSGDVEPSSDPSSAAAAPKTNACTEAGGHCLTHNAPSAKGQGPADCGQFGTWFHGGPLRASPLSCAGVEAAGGVECCVP